MPMVRPRLRIEQGDNSPKMEFFCHISVERLWKSGTRCEVACLDRGQGRPSCRSDSYNVAVPFVIRDSRAEDFEFLWRMDQECFPRGISYSKKELKSYIRHHGSFTLVVTDGSEGEIQGFIIGHSATTGHIITIDVSPRARRSGVGSVLLQAAEDRIRDAGCPCVGLETAVDNMTALSFYKRHGYSVIRTWPRYYPNGVDALVLRKELAGPRSKNCAG